MLSLILLVVSSLLACSGQLMQKQAVHWWAARPELQQAGLLRRLLNPWLIAGIGALGCGMLCWLGVLHTVPLSLAYPMLSLNFVLVAVAARWLFGETLSWRYLGGLALIMAGIVVLGSEW
ncbi:EamA family transporter [Zymobacter sp. IVIA_12111.31 C1]|uniref:EamA family transporter n=1 Tax=Zymobacter sp. IVIA_12111.31 C1 TaxID=3394854 RepID=UPI0039C124BC